MKFFSHCASDFVAGVKLHRLPMVYVLTTKNFEYIKIGKSRSFKQRLRNIQSSCPLPLSLLVCIRSPRANEIEAALHELFAEWNVRGEWFSLSGEAMENLYSFFELTNKNVREASRALL